ncbi:DUF6355 family natural product biosynthesis protein [Streptomyces sp. NPDC026206]|uniref:DUF6355 family natural product biosynthesis protein n=1 Tax=Streptomyces sp. NPDC026206 TaxID=3157089 RepID=UPI0033EAD0BC
MRSRELSSTERPRRTRLLALVPFAVAGVLACSLATPADAAAERINACGWNKSSGGEHAYYEHCATNTNVWIQVTRWPRSDYHRCVGPGRTVLDSDATGAWYDSNYRGGLCSHPGDTGP